jgi:DNA-binding MarR family transcriptional regulator
MSVERVESLLRQLRHVVAQRPDAWSELDLTLLQLKAIYFLWARGPLTLTEFAALVAIRLASASALVERLVRLGLVCRRADTADRRQVRLAVTPEADALLGRLEAVSDAQLREALGRMSPHGLAALETGIAELLAAISGERPAAGAAELPAAADTA